ncbi:MAG: hypothetical protein QOJ29_4451, partial [Thermoleophilaceae bacterium]|nr:hypothetical protein [Thermoleophilaceae bacterium]
MSLGTRHARLARLLVLALILGIVTQATAADPPAGDPPSPPPGLFDTKPVHGSKYTSDKAWIKARQDADAKREARRRWLASPEMKAERQRSRDAFRGEDPAAALGLLRDRFPELTTGDGYDPQGAWHDGLDVIDYKDDFSAVIRDGGRRRLIETTTPIRTTAADGTEVPVDLALTQTADGFEPNQPLVDVELPNQLSSGLSIGTDGVRIVPEGDATGQLSDEQVFYPAVATDTDLTARPTPEGLEFTTVARSSDSPEEMRYDVQIPPGAEIAEDHGAIVVRNSDGPMIRINPPLAVDAQGTEVPVSMALQDGHTLVITAHHKNADVAYPIAVDPTILEDHASFAGSPANMNYWVFTTNWSGAFLNNTSAWAGTYNWGTGLYLFAYNGAYPNSMYGEWYYPVPNGSGHSAYITQAIFRNIAGYTWGEAQTSMYGTAGVWSRGNYWTGVAATYVQNFWYSNVTINPTNDPTSGWAAVLQMTATGGAARSKSAELFLGGASITLDDPDYPVNTGRSAVGVPTSGWYNPNSNPNITSTGSATDNGLGMSSYEARITKADASNTWVASAYTWYYAGSAPCIGTRVSPCQNVPADRQLAWSPNGAGISPANPLPDGAYNVTLGARDAVGKTTWMVTQPLKIDRTAPTVSPESNLSSLNGKTVAGGAYSLTVTGSDATSGIGGVAVYDTFNNVTTLVASSGGPSASWNLNADDANNQGTHNYSFVSYDNAGNASSAGTATITVDQYRYGTAQSTAPSKYFGWYNTSLFDEPLWQQLHTKTFRISVWWNAVSTRGGVLINGVLIDKFNDFTTLVNQALAKGQQVVVSIDSSEEYDNKAKPTPAQYHDAVQQLYLAEPNVAYWGVANEPNAGRTWLSDLPSTT